MKAISKILPEVLRRIRAIQTQNRKNKGGGTNSDNNYKGFYAES